MTQTELIILNFEEIRRRSIKLWSGIPSKYYSWKPDIYSMNLLETIRHVLEGEHLFHVIINNKGNLGDYTSPWTNKPYVDLQTELDFSESFRKDFLNIIRRFDPEDFSTIEIVRSEKGQKRKLGDYLQRVAYHEAVHTGQILSNMRTLGLERPLIWD